MIGIPTGKFIMSLSQLVLLGNWFLEGNFPAKWQKIKSNKIIWLLISFFLLHIIGLLWTSDFNYALNDIRIKLPLLWLPVLIGTSEPLTKKEFDFLIKGFIAAVLFATVISLMVWLGLTKKVVNDIRDISIFNSHIRFALMIVLSCVFLSVGNIFSKQKLNIGLKIILVIWLIAFLFLMESLTGIIILGILVAVFVFKKFIVPQKMPVKIFISALAVLFLFFAWKYVSKEWSEITYRRPVNFYNLDKHTMLGNIYSHDTSAKSTENGNYIYIYNCVNEMRPVWNRRSKVNFDSADAKGNPLWSTLTRFLTSLGVRKDSTGIVSLTSEQIQMVEKGITNINYANANPLATRIHETIWEVAQFYQGHNPSGHSLTMRLEFWRTALLIYKENSFFGVGTGDVQQAFNDMYEKSNSPLTQRWRLRAHNQYLTAFVTFGFLGGLVFLLSLFAPVWVKNTVNPYYFWFLLIATISMLNEDTLETQAGVTFYAFFNAFLLFYSEKSD